MREVDDCPYSWRPNYRCRHSSKLEVDPSNLGLILTNIRQIICASTILKRFYSSKPFAKSWYNRVSLDIPPFRFYKSPSTALVESS